MSGFLNIMTIISFKILNTARLPLENSRGTEAERFAKSRQLSKQLLTELEKGSIYTNEFISNAISKILAPYNIKVTFEENRKNTTRGEHRSNIKAKATDKGVLVEVTGHVIGLPPDAKERNKYTVLHEAGHIFDSAFNPKSMRCDFIKLIREYEIKDSLQEIRNKFLNISNLRKLKKETPQTLKEIPDEYVIDNLQDIRYCLKTEINQYKIGLINMLKDKDISLITFIEELILYSQLKFNQKLRFTNKLLKERISLARKKHETHN